MIIREPHQCAVSWRESAETLLVDRPKIFFDTDVCNAVGDGKISPSEWQNVCARINDECIYQISFITLKEIFAGLARSSPEHFENNKARLRALCQPHSLQFLPYPAVFALRTVLGLHRVARRSTIPEEMLLYLVSTALLQGASKARLKEALGFDLDHFDTHENSPQHRLADLNQGRRTGCTAKPERLIIAKCLLEDCYQTPDSKSCQELALGLDAALTYSEELNKQAANAQFSFHKHDTDWGDMMQLYYLCDESMHFVTFDKGIKLRARRSTQSSRVFLYDDFVRSL